MKEQSYTQNIPEAIQSETEEYSLITSGNKEVSADIDQSLINLRPIVPSPPETYTIIFNGNGGTASQTSMETGTDGTLDTCPLPLETGIIGLTAGLLSYRRCTDYNEYRLYQGNHSLCSLGLH